MPGKSSASCASFKLQKGTKRLRSQPNMNHDQVHEFYVRDPANAERVYTPSRGPHNRTPYISVRTSNFVTFAPPNKVRYVVPHLRPGTDEVEFHPVGEVMVHEGRKWLFCPRLARPELWAFQEQQLFSIRVTSADVGAVPEPYPFGQIDPTTGRHFPDHPFGLHYSTSIVLLNLMNGEGRDTHGNVQRMIGLQMLPPGGEVPLSRYILTWAPGTVDMEEMFGQWHADLSAYMLRPPRQFFVFTRFAPVGDGGQNFLNRSFLFMYDQREQFPGNLVHYSWPMADMHSIVTNNVSGREVQLFTGNVRDNWQVQSWRQFGPFNFLGPLADEPDPLTDTDQSSPEVPSSGSSSGNGSGGFGGSSSSPMSSSATELSDNSTDSQ